MTKLQMQEIFYNGDFEQKYASETEIVQLCTFWHTFNNVAVALTLLWPYLYVPEWIINAN